MLKRVMTFILAGLAVLSPALTHADNVGIACVSETKAREILRFTFDTGKSVMLTGGFDDDPLPVNQPL